ncbi:MAG: class I poly(R)-hydroxyalkanoic acid synthase [Candidatus Eremiobacteraeota bacterium]|nr:class I poly(R)-hydroxyalkanoic acid synthase [Candidatus Eremiobacteraeota bacterium]
MPAEATGAQSPSNNGHSAEREAQNANPFDPLGVNAAAAQVWKAMLTQPEALLSAQTEFAKSWMELATTAWVPQSEKRTPIIEPAQGDNRFKHPAWTENPIFDALKQGYLLATKAVLESIESAPVDPQTRQRVRFFAKQFCDAMSPTNFAFLNPAVIEETTRTGGRNLQRGMENVLEDLRENEGRPSLVDKSAFEVGKNVASTSGSVVFRNELMELIQYAPSTPQVYARPLIIVPPWINKFYVLDLQPTNSFIKYAVDSGMSTFVISWRNPDPSLSKLEMQDYLRLGPVTAAEVAKTITGGSDVNMLGYCIGGTLLAMLLAYFARRGQAAVNAAMFFASLIDFAEAGEIRAFLSDDALDFLEAEMEQKGVLPGRQMADTFNMLRANDLIWNVAVNRYLLGKEAPAFDLLYWNSDATRMPKAMHSYYLRNMYRDNNLVKPDVLTVDGVRIDLRLVKNDSYTVATMEDHIAPWRAVYRMTQLFRGDVQFRLANSGHIAGIINPPGKPKGYWLSNSTNPPDSGEWLAAAEKHEGSWWPDWRSWLQARSGPQVAAPSRMGSDAYPPGEPAPGAYVLEK